MNGMKEEEGVRKLARSGGVRAFMCGGLGSDQPEARTAPTAHARIFLLDTPKRCHHSSHTYQTSTRSSPHRAYSFYSEASGSHSRVLMAIRKWPVRTRHTSDIANQLRSLLSSRA